MTMFVWGLLETNVLVVMCRGYRIIVAYTTQPTNVLAIGPRYIIYLKGAFKRIKKFRLVEVLRGPRNQKLCLI